MTFAQLELIKPLLDALTKKGYESPSPIQEKAIPPILLGKDIFKKIIELFPIILIFDF